MAQQREDGVDARDIVRRTQELTRELKRALKRREKDLGSFDRKLASLRGTSMDAAKSPLARLEKRRKALGEEHVALKGILEEGETLIERMSHLKANVEFEEKRRKRAETELRNLEGTNEALTQETAQLREEIEEKSLVIAELQQLVNVLTGDADDGDDDEVPAAPAFRSTGVYLHVFTKPASDEKAKETAEAEEIELAPLPGPQPVDDADVEPLDEGDDDYEPDLDLDIEVAAELSDEEELGDDDPEILHEEVA